MTRAGALQGSPEYSRKPASDCVCSLCIEGVMMGPILHPSFSAENGGEIPQEAFSGGPHQVKVGPWRHMEDAWDGIGLLLRRLAARPVAWREVTTRALGSHVDNAALCCRTQWEEQE